MTVHYRDALFESYAQRSDALDPDARTKVAWFGAYARAAYLPHLADVPRDAQLLDVGCNRGYLLAALGELGFAHLHGIDLSAAEVEHARGLVPGAALEAVGAVEYCARHPARFDVIITKAVLEHVRKEETLPFLRALRQALRPDGLLIVDVPNMDWLFASHERYMDFTHETGFTQESLAQVLGEVFERVQVMPVDWLPGSTLGVLRRRLARKVLGSLLSWAHPEGGSNPVWARSIVGVAR